MPTPTYKQFSQITVNDVETYLRLAEITLAESTMLGTILEAAKSYVLTYTGRTTEEADTFPEFTIAVYVICEDMFDKRTYTVDADSTNKIVDSILGSRSINLL